MPSLRCLISALTQAGGGDFLLMFASSIQSRCGEGGALQADVAVCGSTRRVLARQPAVLAPSPRVLRAFSLRGEQLGWPEVFTCSSRVRRAFSLRSERPGQPEVWRPFPWRSAPFPSVASGPGSQRFGALSTGAPRLFPPRPQRVPPLGYVF